mmetsp:Transcript_2977/g.5996  ORF Transcript_2977/g.5996 Transcript_2977/m.5996 type:complete len:325 (-) Transcript_2977:248-1222(-)
MMRSKYGRFPPRCRYSGDQVPLPFIVGNNSTFENTGATSVQISQPSDGLEKRQATMHLTFRPVEMKESTDTSELGKRKNREPLEMRFAKQPRAALIFRGQGLRIKESEKAAWDPDVDVYFQKKAWVDRPIAIQIAKKTWKQHVDECHTSADGTVEKTMTLFDNLDAQTHSGFKAELNALNSESFFYPGGETDELAPVDAGYGKDVKHGVGVEMDKWLEEEGNLEKWEGGASALSASDRRVLMTIWVSAAKKKVDAKYYSLWRYFEKTGGLMTVDGSGDDQIKPSKLPEGVSEYKFVDEEAESKEVEESAMWAAHRCAKARLSVL